MSEESERILPAGAETPYRPRVPAGEENALLKQETSTGVQPVPRSTAGLWAFFRGELVPLDDARISVTTHAFNYGTAVFEGVRAYWNPEQEQLYGLDLLAHFQRLHRSAPILQLDLRYPERHPQEQLVYSAARELLANVVRHADASRVAVTLAEDDGDLSLVVADDGRGFPFERPAEALAEGHVGLASQRVRVEAVGGTMDVASGPDGTRAEIRLPR